MTVPRLAATLFVLAWALCIRAEDAYEEPELSELDGDHWSFRPLERPAVPTREGDRWSRNPVDQFVLRGLTALQLQPGEEATPQKLVRRVYLDVLGMPPTPEEVIAFLEDRTPDAYERLVDRLLASPDYGPRWAQFWLDLARFAETDGFEHDKVRAQAWKYRDWVIDAFNADVPYDQFVRLQLAGDLIAPGDEAAQIATSFCLSGPDMPDINLQEERRHGLLNEMTATVGAVFLGLQVGCAQCHDHMYDPISQADFYRLRAFFEPAVHVQRDQSVSFLQEDAGFAVPSRLMIRGDFRRPGPALEAAVPRVLQAAPPDPCSRLSRVDLASWVTAQRNPLTARVIANRIWQFHFGRGLSATPSDFGVMGDVPSHPELLDWLASELVASGWQLKQFHRLILTSATYRQQGEQPALANQQARWAAALRRDPDNRWLSRFPRRRLEAEVIRDAMYAMSDALCDTMRGPGVRPPLPPEMLGTLLKDQWTPTEAPREHYRRSIYIFARRNLRFPLLAMLDRPSANDSCAQRQASTTAPQSLLMLNSAASLDAARRFAGYVIKHADFDPRAQVRLAIRRAFGREATATEEATLEAFLQREATLTAEEGHKELALPIPTPPQEHDAAAAALTTMCLALLNSNEFIYVD